MNLRTSTIAILGVTGAVGREALAILQQRGVPAANIRALASARSAGSELPYTDSTLRVAEVTKEAFHGVDAAIFAASGDAARAWARVATQAGADVIDNSSAFRMDPAVPLVVPEVNPEAIPAWQGSGRLIANPNCSTIMMLMAVTAIRQRFGCDRLVVSTYQAASGAGAAAMDELVEQTRRALAGQDPVPQIFKEPCAFNVFSHNADVDPITGRNTEEEKLIRETRKIWNDPEVRITGTCIRVPVLRAHTEAINITLKKPATEAEVRDAVAAFPGVQIIDDRASNNFPTPRKASGIDDVLVGRIRPDGGETADTEGRYLRFDLMCSGDQLRKGAALNAVQIASLLDR